MKVRFAPVASTWGSIYLKPNKKNQRDYNNESRAEKVLLTKQKIIELYVNLLVANNGQDVSLQTLAKKAKISIRTLFRFFGDKESLNNEIEEYLSGYLSAVSENLEKMNFADYAAFSYKVFDQYEKLFKVYLFTDFGQKSRMVFRKKFTDLLVKKIKAELKLQPNNAELLKIYFVISLINAHIWKDMQDSFGVSGDQLSGTVKWAVQQLLSELKTK